MVQTFTLGYDRYCGGPVMRTRGANTGRCERCGFFSSVWWWTRGNLTVSRA